MAQIQPAAAIAAYIQEHRERQAADKRRRLLLVGESGTGKTYSSCTTAPNVYVIDSDDGLEGIPESAGVKRIPLVTLDDAKKVDASASTLLDAALSFTLGIAKRIATQHDNKCTFIYDSISTIGDQLMKTLEDNPESKSNKFWLWAEWARKWRDLCTAIKQLPCNVVCIAHEQPEWEYNPPKPPVLVQYTWYMPGNQFSPRLATFFTDAVRALKFTNAPTVDKQKVAFPDASLSGKPPAVREKYYWQVKPERLVPWCKSRYSGAELMIPADWNELMK